MAGLALLGAFRWLTSIRARRGRGPGVGGEQKSQILPSKNSLLRNFLLLPIPDSRGIPFSEYRATNLSPVHRTAVIFLVCVDGQDA